jgi:hypothetical protein
MKRNPLYSPNANRDEILNINGIRIRTQPLFNVYLTGETKQEKFNYTLNPSIKPKTPGI